MSPSGGRRVLTPQEEMAGFALRKLPTDESQPFSDYHDPKTGRVFPHLPADSWSQWHYAQRSKKRPNGWRMGPPPSSQTFPTEVPDLTGEGQKTRRIAELEQEIAALRDGEKQPEATRQPVQLKLI